MDQTLKCLGARQKSVKMQKSHRGGSSEKGTLAKNSENIISSSKKYKNPKGNNNFGQNFDCSLNRAKFLPF